MFMEITSSENQKYKYIKSLLDKKGRIKHQAFMIEGKKSVQDAIESDRVVLMIAVSDEFAKIESMDYPENVLIYKMPHSLFCKLCDTKTPQGILAVIAMDTQKELEADLSGFYVYCDGVADPGNLGTIIRTAESAGAKGVLLSSSCVDVYNPKIVRSTMGTFFNIPIYEKMGIEDLTILQEQGFQLVSGALHSDTISYLDCDMTLPTILVVGNEANGISDEVLELTDVYVKIPMVGKAESLNVGVATGILIYEIVRQRKN